MKSLLKPKWIFIINTLPIAVLFFLFYSEYTIIKSLLEDENIALWKSFGSILGLLGIANFAYGIYLLIKKKNVSIFYALLALVCYISFIYMYGFLADSIIPLSIPRWMVTGNMVLYVGTFLMPTLAYSFFVLIAYLTPKTESHKAWRDFMFAIAVPMLCYLFVQIILPLWKPVESNYSTHTLLIFIIIATLFFLFFLVRAIYVIISNKAVEWQKYQLLWKIPITIVFPIIGLLINNGHWSDFYIDDSGVFGDFGNYWFYSITILNGLLICLPNLDNKLYSLFLFFGRSITFAFTFYFFIVFLPFLPLSIVAIVAFGTGFLMLSPLLLFMLHINELSKNYEYLSSKISINSLRVIFAIGFLIIPICLTSNYLNDKNTLNETLEYLYSPNYSKHYDIDTASLQKTLSIVNRHKSKNIGGIFGTQQPYLSSYFNWLVLDNLTLSDAKIDFIKSVFFGNNPITINSENIQNKEVEITDITTSSTYNSSEKSWTSWIDLEITNKSGSNFISEYATTIALPEATWISDYYLYVGDKKEMGILAEKRSALWVFSNIRNENRDPGILYYLTGNRVAFRVFPFAKDEVRKTGIQLIHKNPIEFTIDGTTVLLGNTGKERELIFENKNVIFVSAEKKKQLKKIQRKPYFHFIINATSDTNIVDFAKRIKDISKKHKALSENAQISFANSYTTTTPLDADWLQQYKSQHFKGGFYADRAIKSVLYNSYKNQSNTFPVIVVVGNNIHEAVFQKNFLDWSFSYPELDRFYHLNTNGNLTSHSLITNPYVSNLESAVLFFNKTVLEYKLENNTIRYLPDNNQASIILKEDLFRVTESEIKEKNWNTGLTLQAKWISQILHPETSDREWLPLVRNSFISKIMTPVTSYLVVENEAQKAILKKKQAQVLSSNKSLDLGDEAQRMSEPDLYIIAILFGLIWFYRSKRQKRF